MKEVKFKGKVAKRKTPISVKNQKMRLRWAKIHSKWTIEQWKTVLLTDETKINQFGSDGIIRTWQKKGESIIMVWGSFSWFGMGNFKIVDGIMTKEYNNGIL